MHVTTGVTKFSSVFISNFKISTKRNHLFMIPLQFQSIIAKQMVSICVIIICWHKLKIAIFNQTMPNLLCFWGISFTWSLIGIMSKYMVCIDVTGICWLTALLSDIYDYKPNVNTGNAQYIIYFSWVIFFK